MFKKTFLLTAGVLLVSGCSSTNSTSNDTNVKEETQSSGNGIETLSDYHTKVEDLQAAMMEAV
ncbi:hypothetical protein JMA_29280 [Jeotgalibacillus malaysiensis]|uniref:Uncharacterized protein n=1 Tax=Jeotgalibacillus malaysiensis TaxID=1508404 RepID=A0A0B5APT4_9BACL|nr:hypothetical protein [Jeotgalibacillus malaysiensis]AJD92245.1 hypothetical protein JMA_29280 [Jeotgalibacillus malaysiensis]